MEERSSLWDAFREIDELKAVVAELKAEVEALKEAVTTPATTEAN